MARETETLDPSATLRTGAERQPRGRLHRKTWLGRRNLKRRDEGERQLAAMQPVKDQQRRRTVDKRRHPAAYSPARVDHMAHTAALARMIQ